ncbi:IstB domain protein ATP-binding protein [Desulfonatronospira thiodismutans ASO3-1]|uniref:IstB domain protein ATP-binding protein n=1 Tax=Desulfonatronospira thiodismutans ASO3-1 TaxID=555779 RepID=D6SJV3_9BACT|nr:IS21-like element helper ATPase IstB [Desulfonatronospira thiodismutans]EFI32772.1 IstB domain protein ATP-binding protein [Desulfonatronospira thiodismutans ASO3-1]EFI35552.1 IstB domain protein ATP-binding protein [Desulfonatronospira thiodismutans ASO3-1]EFI36156.1 IstB domain protein ATP-binding protein [Desulfonatronospira thiodismutans ASO3-1]
MTNKHQSEVHRLEENLQLLKLTCIKEQYRPAADKAARQNWDHLGYLARLVQAEADARHDRSIQRRIRMARFPGIKTMENFDWTWPTKINRPAIQNLFRLGFMKDKANIIILGGVGLGKSHIATALGYSACLEKYSVLFATTIDVINTLSAAQAAHKLKTELKKYVSPELLILDELGYLPIDKQGADLLFQVISQRYEQKSTILTTNRAFKKWPEVFNNDSTLTSAMLDRLLHHAETVLIEGKSYRMKDQVQEQ